MTDDTFHDALVAPDTSGLPDRFFDRFVFNLHPVDAPSPSVLIGLGVHPPKDVVDGFAVLVTGTEQRNVRFSTELSATDGASAGPFSWQVVEPMKTWKLVLGANPTGMEFDLLWHARTPAWTGEVNVDNDGATPTSFAHLVQSGYYSGTLSIDGRQQSVDGWYGQRDRSRGVRTLSGGQGLHVWYQAQFPDRSIGFLLVETRQHDRLLLEGAVMHENGLLDDIVDVRHDLRFDDGLDLKGGTVEVTTESGAVYTVDTDASAGGGYMAGAGYGGHHGRPKGRDHIEHDVYPLDGTVSPRTLDSALTDRLASFTWNGTEGRGIFEFAMTRSRSYTYRPSLR
ncbi:hypothetical protein [Streptomyces sp. NPDC127119]|uniref:DUF7064 domain-containing protein n=1 Tax=Streptomyces sp. NPDC127119 TaxID=3345370 RepID=UPI0036337B6B